MYTRFLTFLGDKTAPGMIRVILPYLYINSINTILANYDFVIQTGSEIYQNLNVLQFQRAATQHQLELIRHIKKTYKDKYGFKIFYEIDDLVLDIPEYNFSHNYYKTNKKYLEQILSEVDCIVCSTVELEKYMKEYNKTFIMKNRLIRSLWETEKRETFFDTGEKPKIIYCGGMQHFSNTDGDFSKEIIDFIISTKDQYNWIFFGSSPLELKNKVIFIPWVHNYFEYIYKLKQLKPDIGIALLNNNNFNKCKSNIKALEYTALNIPGIYSKIQPYYNLSIRIDDIDQFKEYITLLTTNKVYYKKIREKDYNTLKDNLYWDKKYADSYIKTYLTF